LRGRFRNPSLRWGDWVGILAHAIPKTQSIIRIHRPALDHSWPDEWTTPDSPGAPERL
jgi:hypothetical protein